MVLVTKEPHCRVKFDITVTPQAVAASYHKALKNVNKEVSIPGFRKGRAPDQMILEKYHSTIQKEFVDLVLNTAFNEALQLTHLHPLKEGVSKRPTVHECSREKGAHFVVEFEVRPTVPSVRFEDLQLKKNTAAPLTDRERENSLQQVVLQFATYEPIEDRPVQEDDFVDLSVTLLENPPREIIHNQRGQVNATGLPIWLRHKVIGLQVGESAEGMTEQDPSLAEPAADFQPLPFRVTVNAILKGDLPPVDDELAKRVGLQSLDELNQKIDERLQNEMQEDAYQANIQSLERLLVEKYAFDLPQSYIDNQTQARFDDYLADPERQAEGQERNLKQVKKALEEISIHQLQLFFLLRKIAADHHIDVTQEDINQELTRQLALLQSGRSQLNITKDKDNLHEQLHHLALERKIKQFLLGHVNFV
jgi:trigger factor